MTFNRKSGYCDVSRVTGSPAPFLGILERRIKGDMNEHSV